MEYFELDLVTIACAIAEDVTGVERVALFGSRKYPGKVRSDVDLLISGPSTGDVLIAFRESNRLYAPLDLWLDHGGSAFSVVNGSTLNVRDLDAIELYPTPDLERLKSLSTQRFRADVTYVMSMAPTPPSVVPLRGDNLHMLRRLPTLFEEDLTVVAVSIVKILEHAIQAMLRMRSDGNARRGKGSHLTLSVEYDFQNLTELLLSPIFPTSREPFVVKVAGSKRSADFALADSRIALELKFAKNGSELSAELKDAHAVLRGYLDHPGVELALGLVGIAEDVEAKVNDIESWSDARGDRIALMRVIRIPVELMRPFTT